MRCKYTTFNPFMKNTIKYNKEKNVPLRWENTDPLSGLWATVSIGSNFHKEAMI